MAHLRELLRERTDAKDQSRANLLRKIMSQPGNQSFLSRRAGMSPPAVHDAVSDLSKEGLVVVRKQGKENIVSMAPTEGAAVGIELGFQATAIVARLVHQPHDQVAVALCRTGAARGPKSWLDEVVDGIHEVVARVADHPDDIGSIGLGIPRMVNSKDLTLIPPLLPPWDSAGDFTELCAELAGRLTDGAFTPQVKVDNDANLSAQAESVYGFPDADTLVAVKASTGVGIGIIADGKIYRGRRGIAGEFGHVVVEPGGRFCSCGGRGCLETLVGADALVEQAKTVLGHKSQPSPSTLADLVTRAGQGNVVCQRVLREAAWHLGFALGNLCNILNPQVIVLGGAFGRPDAVQFTLAPCREAITHSAMRAAYETDFALEPGKVVHGPAQGALVLGLEGTTY